ncbi:MAG: hypothetical protein ACRDQ1_14485 [Sciscionella sp.]
MRRIGSSRRFAHLAGTADDGSTDASTACLADIAIPVADAVALLLVALLLVALLPGA